jgi:hypothetical protein
MLRKKQRVAASGAAVKRRPKIWTVWLLDATTADFAIVNLMYSLYATIRVSRPSEAAYLSQLDVNGNRRQRVEHCQQSLQCREQSASIRRSDEDEKARR